jgi:hypothetical protein
VLGKPLRKKRYENRCSGKKQNKTILQQVLRKTPREKLYEKRFSEKTQKNLYENRLSGNKEKPRKNDMRTDAPRKKQNKNI